MTADTCEAKRGTEAWLRVILARLGPSPGAGTLFGVPLDAISPETARMAVAYLAAANRRLCAELESLRRDSQDG